MAVGECWHSKVKVAPDGTAPDVVIQVPAGSYLVLAKVSFVQKAPYSIDSSGGVQKTTYEDSRGLLQLVFDEYESQRVVDSCEAQFGAAEYSLEPILEFPTKSTNQISRLLAGQSTGWRVALQS